MRTIKFRGKREGKNDWIYFDLMQAILDEDGFTGEFLEYKLNDETVGQFTGLHDKNGKEIYEGDILKTFPIISSDKTSYDSFNVVVRFTSSSWIANGVLGFRQAEISEVIGNFYENPELLTD